MKKIKFKICTKCKEEKSISEFSKNKRHKDNLAYQCKSCCSNYAKKHYQDNKKEYCTRIEKWKKANPKFQADYQKEYYKANKERMNKQSKEWKLNNPEYGKEYYSMWRQNNLEKEKESGRKWREKNPEYRKMTYKNNAEKERAYAIQYRIDNLEKVKKHFERWRKDKPDYYAIRAKKKYHTDPIFKINLSMSNSIRISLKGNKKGRHWETLVGYTLDELIKHLKLTIPSGYVWNDYIEGKLHLDHKIPLSIFNIKGIKSKGFKKAWALENLQFLPEKVNRQKGNKLFYC